MSIETMFLCECGSTRCHDILIELESQLAAAKAEIAEMKSHQVNPRLDDGRPTQFELMQAENKRLREALEKIGFCSTVHLACRIAQSALDSYSKPSTVNLECDQFHCGHEACNKRRDGKGGEA